MKLQNKIALITGAGRGIGRSISFAFAGQGADVILVARTQKELDDLAQEIQNKGNRAVAMACDISSRDSIDKLAREIKQAFGHIDILVNNAGISRRAKFLEYDDEVWFQVIQVNLFGVYLCTKAFLPMMQKAGIGRIINVASVAGKAPAPFNTAYSASKHAVLGLTKSLASEIALCGYPEITVNAICPFFVDTDMFRGPHGYISQLTQISGASETEIESTIVDRNLQKRVLSPEEVAGMALYLASDEARGVTGQAFNICGGRIFH